jgi:hypothetical protein
MGFFDIFQQAPIEERLMQGVPQSPAVQAAPGVNPAGTPMPPPAPAMAPQAPGSLPQPQPNPALQNRWQGLMDRITQPDVLGPLQTFLAAASAPMQPGENMGARLGYASTLMQMHRAMLQENAKMAPHLERARELEMQKMELENQRIAAATESSQAQTQETRQRTDRNWEQQPLDTEMRQLEASGARLSQEQKALQLGLDKQFGAGDRELSQKSNRMNIEYKQALIDAMKQKASPQELAVMPEDAFRANYDAVVIQPYKTWAQAQRRENPAALVDFATYLEMNKQAAKMANDFITVATQRGIRLEWQGLERAQPQSSGKKNWVMGADGQLKEAK